MLFIYEMKKIFKRLTPVFFLVFVIAVAAVTIIVSAIGFNHPTTEVDHTDDYAALQNKIQNWDEPRQDGMSQAFADFYEQYKIMNAATYNNDNLVAKYNNAKEAFQSFYADYYCRLTQASDYLLVHQDYFDNLNEIMKDLNQFFTGQKNEAQIREGLAINTKWENTSLQTILDKIHVQKIKDTDLAELKDFLEKNTYSNDAYIYARNKYLLAVVQNSQYDGHLASYHGFADYVDNATCEQNIKLAQHRLENADTDFSQPFAFGKIYNNTSQVSLMDFVFNNLEMASIPILILVIILAACTFFTDVYQGTVITALSATKKRYQVILSKTLAVLVLTIVTLLLFTGIYITTGLLFFNAQIAPSILFLFNGTQIAVMSQINYFVLYFFSLLFKMLPFIALCGLFSFSKADPRLIVGCTMLAAIVVILCNAILGSFWFYQFVPLLALDPIRYFGAQLFISPTPSTYNIWFTLPVMLIITVYLYWQLIHNFKKKDF